MGLSVCCFYCYCQIFITRVDGDTSHTRTATQLIFDQAENQKSTISNRDGPRRCNFYFFPIATLFSSFDTIFLSYLHRIQLLQTQTVITWTTIHRMGNRSMWLLSVFATSTILGKEKQFFCTRVQFDYQQQLNYSYVDKLPDKGETVRANRFHTYFGGKGANQCVAAAKLGSKTALISKVWFGLLFLT